MLRIGLTGAIASGKSCVSSMLKQRGAHIIDYDILARKAVEPGSDALLLIAGHFGKKMIDENGCLNRKLMSKEIFSGADSVNKRRELENILHPIVFRMACEYEKNIAKNKTAAIVVHDIPLLAETSEQNPFQFDHTVSVEADRETRIERMMSNRAMTREEAESRIKAQAPDCLRRKIADIVIENNADIQALQTKVDALCIQWINEEKTEKTADIASWKTAGKKA